MYFLHARVGLSLTDEHLFLEHQMILNGRRRLKWQNVRFQIEFESNKFYILKFNWNILKKYIQICFHYDSAILMTMFWNLTFETMEEILHSKRILSK